MDMADGLIRSVSPLSEAPASLDGFNASAGLANDGVQLLPILGGSDTLDGLNVGRGLR